MEIAQAKEKIKVGQLASRISMGFLLLSQFSLGAMIVLAPFRYHLTLQTRQYPRVFGDYTNLYLYIADIPLLLTLVFWFFSRLCLPKRISLQPRWLTFSLVGLVSISMISSFFSIDSRLSLYNGLRMLALFGLYLYLINEVHSLKIVLAPASLQLFIQSVIGIAQVLKQHSLGLVMLKELQLNPAVNGVSIVWAAGMRSLRAYGLTDHPNILGGCLVFVLVLLIASYLESRPAWRPLLGGLIGLGALALLLTFSRSAWLGFFAGLALTSLWLVFFRMRERMLALAGLCIGVLLLLMPFLWNNAPFLGSRLNSDGSFNAVTPENQSIHERSILVAQAIKIIAGHPLFGTGLGTFPEALQQQDRNYPFDYQPPHLVGLEIAAEIGLPGAVFYLAVLVAPLILLFANRGARKQIRLDLSLQLAGVTAALLAIIVISFLDYYPWLWNPGRLWQWLLWGLWGAVYMSLINRWKHA